MSLSEIKAIKPAQNAVIPKLRVAVFSATSFLSALLLFCIEPMFSKMVLPVLGGSSAVWSIAMVVFQGLLLAGYIYAWLITQKLPSWAAMLIHLGVVVLATFCLPVAMSPLFGDPPQQEIALWLVAFFLVSIGLPFFAVAANAPLLQTWFSHGSDDANPYFLYRASNFGSFLVLLAYPLLIEPAFGLRTQSWLWSIGYALLALALVVCMLLTMRSAAMAPIVSVERNPVKIAWRDRGAWAVLGFIPSGLLVAVTAHISTDVASAPFLWIAPLAIYLLSFVIAFTDKPVIPLRALLIAQPAMLALLAFLLIAGPALSWEYVLLGHLTAFFVVTMICQSLLYARRPDVPRLAEFYVWMSFGGLLGGIFAALIAPAIFTTVLEYPLLFLAAFSVRPDLRTASRQDWKNGLGLIVTIIATLIVAAVTLNALGLNLARGIYQAAIVGAGFALPFLYRKPVQAFAIGTALLIATSLLSPSQNVIYRARSFFGVYKVVKQEDGTGTYHLFAHGTTWHGEEKILDARRTPITGNPEPLAYYYHGGAISGAIEAARGAHPLAHVAAVGLGIGALACYRVPREDWTFYELDPLVLKIARDRQLFRTFSDCAGNSRVILGDARLTLKEAPRGYDVLLMDAFTSDSVPVHLLTREAFALYKSKLAPHGVIIFHISNRNLELADIVAASSAANRMVSAVHRSGIIKKGAYKIPSEVAIVAQSPSDLAALKLDGSWKSVQLRNGFRTWTDDYSDVFGALLQRVAK